MTNEDRWMMDDEGGIRVMPGRPASWMRSETPLFMATARERNASLGIKPSPYLYSEPAFHYAIKTTELTPWN